MALTNSEAEHFREKVVPNEHHDQDEVIDDAVDIEVLYFAGDLTKLVLEILPQNADNHELELHFTQLADGGAGFILRPSELLPDD